MWHSRATVAILAGALAVGPMWAAGAAPEDAQKGLAKSSVTLSVPVTETVVADEITASVQVQPGAARTVEIQLQPFTGGWETVASATTDASGSADVPFTTYKSGGHLVRAVAPATDRQEKAISATSALTAKYPGFGPPPQEELNPLVPGKLEIKKKAAKKAKKVKIGDYRLKVKKGGKAKVVVKDGAGRVAWANDPGTAFLTASRSELRWFDRSTAGRFWAQVERTARMTKQTVTSVKAEGNAVTIAGKVKGSGEKAVYEITVKQVKPGGKSAQLLFDASFDKKKSTAMPNSVQMTSGRSAGASVHGFGSQFQGFDLSGQVLPILVQEQGITRGQVPESSLVDQASWGAGNAQTTYGAWPTYVTGQNRSFEMADTLAGGSFAIADTTRPRQVSLESFDNTFKARVLARGKPRDLMAARSAGISRRPLAGWTQDGAVLGLQGGTDKVRQVVAEMEQAGTKVAGVWLQDWVGRRVTGFGEQLWWTWQLNEKRYPGWSQMVRDFKAKGIEVMTYVNPFVIDADEVDGQPIRNLYKEGASKGYLVKNKAGGTYVVETIGFPTALVDLTNPKARDWYADIIADEVLGVGATGFMADFGEALPFDSVVKKGTALEQHNRWPQLWAKTVQMGCKRGGVPDCVAFMRSSYLGSRQNAPLMWAGDQMVNFAKEDGLASAILGMLSGGVSGHPLWHSDIGGYTSIRQLSSTRRPADLNARWGEMQAFGVMMRSHEGNIPPENQQIYDTAQTRAEYAKASRIFAALAPYRKGVLKEAIKSGIPAMRHTWLVYPGSKAAQQDLQFFLGADLFVAPVVEQGATSVAVTFPPGKWEHILTGQTFTGDTTTTVAAPIGTPAAFVKVGDPEGKKIVAAMKSAGLRQ